MRMRTGVIHVRGRRGLLVLNVIKLLPANSHAWGWEGHLTSESISGPLKQFLFPKTHHSGWGSRCHSRPGHRYNALLLFTWEHRGLRPHSPRTGTRGPPPPDIGPTLYASPVLLAATGTSNTWSYLQDIFGLATQRMNRTVSENRPISKCSSSACRAIHKLSRSISPVSVTPKWHIGKYRRIFTLGVFPLIQPQSPISGHRGCVCQDNFSVHGWISRNCVHACAHLRVREHASISPTPSVHRHLAVTPLSCCLFHDVRHPLPSPFLLPPHFSVFSFILVVAG